MVLLFFTEKTFNRIHWGQMMVMEIKNGSKHALCPLRIEKLIAHTQTKRNATFFRRRVPQDAAQGSHQKRVPTALIIESKWKGFLVGKHLDWQCNFMKEKSRKKPVF